MRKSLDKNITVALSASIVLYNNDIKEAETAIRCVLESNLVSEIFLIDNSPSDKLKALKKSILKK